MTTTIPLNYTEQYFAAKEIITGQEDNIICQLLIADDVDLQRLIQAFHATAQEIDFLWVNLDTMPGHMAADPDNCRLNESRVRILDEVATLEELATLRADLLKISLLRATPHIHLDVVKYHDNYALLVAVPHMLLDGIANYIFLSRWFENYEQGAKPAEKFAPPVFKHTENVYQDFPEALPAFQEYYQDSQLLTVPEHAFDENALNHTLDYKLPKSFEMDLRATSKKLKVRFEIALLATITKTINQHLGVEEFSLRYNRHGRRTNAQREAFRFLLEDPVMKVNAGGLDRTEIAQNILGTLEQFDKMPRVPHFMSQSMLLARHFPELQGVTNELMQSLHLPPSVYIKPEVMNQYGYMLQNLKQFVKPANQILAQVNITPSVVLARVFAIKAIKAGMKLNSINFDFNHAKFRELHIFFTKDIDNRWRLFTKAPIKSEILDQMMQTIISEARNGASDAILETSATSPKQLSA